MEDQRSPQPFNRSDEVPGTGPGRDRRQPLEQRGPYETNYTISLGYPEREVVAQ